MRLFGRIVGVLALIVVVLIGTGLVVGDAKMNAKYAIAPEQLALSVPIEGANVRRGQHFVAGIASCMECHGAHLQGTVFLDVPPFRVTAPNLTRGNGGVATTFSDADFVRAIRHGVAPDGRGLIVMPSEAYSHLSDQDLADIIAYVKSVPPADNVMPPTDIRPLGLVMLAVGMAPTSDAAKIDHVAAHPSTVPSAISVQYGGYLANVAGCTGCHGAGLSGGPIAGLPPSAPPAQNITPTGIGTWTESDFMRALRIGRRPDGTTIDSLMPWATYTRMSDAEISALWLYIHSVPPRQTGTH